MSHPPEDSMERDVDIDEVLTELEELEEIVDRDEELKQVRETIRTARKVRPQGIIGRFSDSFGIDDAGEAVVGAFVFGLPMIVEDGVLEIGRFLADKPVFLLVTILFGGYLIYGVLHAGEFERVREDRLFGVLPLRLVAIIVIAVSMAGALMTVWGRVTWDQPMVAVSQTLLIAIAMGVGASLGDILPER